ncbi:unnamed protein product [Musa hybrid cultivar]
MRERLRVNRMLGVVGEQEAWTDLPSEPSAHQILRLGSRVMRYERLSCPVPPPKAFGRHVGNTRAYLSPQLALLID